MLTDRPTKFQSRISNTQPPVPSDIIELVHRTIESTQARIPALERSIQEIRQEWKL
jgi:hypothetical protein